MAKPKPEPRPKGSQNTHNSLPGIFPATRRTVGRCGWCLVYRDGLSRVVFNLLSRVIAPILPLLRPEIAHFPPFPLLTSRLLTHKQST
ncbi:MAG: hypothetical protein ACOYOO_05160 [Saprospiraceae bacterium]